MFFALLMYILGLEVQYREGMVVKKDSFQALVFAARPNTLTASVAPVLLSACLAALLSPPFRLIPYLLCLIFAVCMQIVSNLVNDLYDFKKGADDGERLGPPRACAMGWASVQKMKRWILLFVSIGCLSGLPLVFYGGYTLILVGILCVLFAYLYTTFFSYRGLGDVLVLLFFGVVPVCFTYYVETLTFSWNIFYLSLGMGFVTDTLLMVNNFRDFEQDSKNGKKTLAVFIGRDKMLPLYLISGLLGPLSTLWLIPQGYWLPTLMTLPYIILHVISYVKMKRIGQGAGLNKVLASAASNIFIFSFLLSASFLIEKFFM